MKTYTDLYPQVCAFENIFKAYRDARKAKRKFASVAAFELNQEKVNFNNNIGFRVVVVHVFGISVQKCERV